MSNASLIKKQEILLQRLERAISNFAKIENAKRSKAYIQSRITHVQQLWQSFQENDTKLCEVEDETADSTIINYQDGKLYESFEAAYFEFLGELEEFDRKVSPTVKETKESVRKSEVKLPRIDIPKFNGEYTSWRTFHDMFVSLIHSDDRIPDVQKLHYLKSSVSGEAERIIKQFDVIATNYKAAWDTLLKRYDNKRVLISSQLASLFNMPYYKQESERAIKDLLDKTQEYIHELNALEVLTENWDPIISFMVIQRLPPETRNLWEQKISETTTLPTLKQLYAYLESRFRTLEALTGATGNKALSRTSKSTATYHINETGNCMMCKRNHALQYCNQFQKLNIERKRGFLSKNNICFKCLTRHSNENCSATGTCTMCKGSHALFLCNKFQQLSTNSRKEFILKHKCCFNCLRRHNYRACPSNKGCSKCGKRHHTLLHGDIANTNKETDAAVNPTASEVTNCTTQSRHMRATQSLLATAIVKVESDNGISLTLRALVDLGSQSSFITESAYQLLQVKAAPTCLRITGLGSSKVATSSKEIFFKLKAHMSTGFTLPMQAYVVKNITNIVPPTQTSAMNWEYIGQLELADPRFMEAGKIDLLLGANIYSKIICNEIIQGPQGSPIAQKTKLGWILFGELMPNPPKEGKTSNFSISTNEIAVMDDRIDVQLRKFWECEELSPERKLTEEEQRCEDFYQKTHLRQTSGRYQVRLPFQNGKCPQLGESRRSAITRFLQLEKRFKTDASFKDLYSECISNYIELGHMVPLDKTKELETKQDDVSRYYLPHHAVFKDSTTTKLRVVFDASAKTSNGKSLNEQLMTGPTIQPKLFSTLMKWRRHKYALNADIEKMYRMIDIHSDDQRYQTILWRGNSCSEPIREYELTTVTFGMTSAPYLAIKTVQQLAIDDKEKYPTASKVVSEDLYVDDVLTGADTIEEALKLQGELINLFKGGGFKLRKWATNDPILLENIPIADREIELPLKFEEENQIKALGIQWHPASDYFTFAFKEHEFNNPAKTKRELLSQVAKLYDPLGWIAPCVIVAKIMMQKLWLTGCNWDELIPMQLSNEWCSKLSQSILPLMGD